MIEREALESVAATDRRDYRVLQVGKYYPPYMGGIETHLHTLCQELRSRVDLRVLVANDRPEREESLMDGVSVTRLSTAFHLASAPVCPRMAGSIRAARANLVHLHLPNPAAVIAYLVSGHRGPLVISYHSDIIRQKVLGRAFEPILHRCLARASAIVVATPNHIDSSPVLQRHRSRCVVIPYGIPLRRFEQVDASAVSAIRQKYGPRIVVSVGRLVYYKGFEFLIDAMRRVDANLLLIGDGPLRASLLQRAEAAGVAGRVHLLSRVEDLAPFYHAADLFVLPSVWRSEAFGIVQLEAMAAGKPVVNTALDSGVPFVSLHDVTGLTVPPGDAAALAEAMTELMEAPERRRALGAAALDRVRGEFSKEVMGERMLNLYDRLVHRSQSGSGRPALTRAKPAGAVLDES